MELRQKHWMNSVTGAILRLSSPVLTLCVGCTGGLDISGGNCIKI
jgi:hypothetical protein